MKRSGNNLSMLLAGAAFLLAGYWMGAAQNQAKVIAQDAEAPAAAPAEQPTSMMPIGVSIPNGGAAVVKGKDGYAYIVDSRGLYVRAAQSGKPLALP